MSGNTKRIKCSYCRKPFESDGSKQCPDCREKIRQKNERWEKAVQNEGYNMALYNARKEAGLSKREVAKLSGMSESGYRKCEAGEMDLSEQKRARVARVLKKPVEALWERPYQIRCRSCLSTFAPVNGERVCQACREDARRTAQQTRSQEPGTNQKKIATIARMARKKGMTYGEYVGREYEERMGNHG